MSWSPLDDLDDHGRTPSEARAQSACRCPGEMPGTCPGPSFCPMCAPDEADDTPMWKGIKIVTDYWRKPIPRSDHDWTATTDNYEPGHPMGYGSTEAGAIADLKEQLEDME